MREALVEDHRDVRSELRLDVGRLLRSQRMRRAVEVRAEVRALLVDRAPVGQAEHLVTAAVGEDGLAPADEAMQAAATRDQIVAGAEVEVIGVAEQDLGAEAVE